VLIGGNVAQSAIARLGAALAEVARDGRDQSTLQLRVSVNLRAGDNVLRVPVMALVVDELSGVTEHSGGSQPAFVFGRERVRRLELAKKLDCVCAHRIGLAGID